MSAHDIVGWSEPGAAVTTVPWVDCRCGRRFYATARLSAREVHQEHRAGEQAREIGPAGVEASRESIRAALRGEGE